MTKIELDPIECDLEVVSMFIDAWDNTINYWMKMETMNESDVIDLFRQKNDPLIDLNNNNSKIHLKWYYKLALEMKYKNIKDITYFWHYFDSNNQIRLLECTGITREWLSLALLLGDFLFWWARYIEKTSDDVSFNTMGCINNTSINPESAISLWIKIEKSNKSDIILKYLKQVLPWTRYRIDNEYLLWKKK